jgi:hypothetical protein
MSIIAAIVPGGIRQAVATADCSSFPGYSSDNGYAAWLTSVYKINTDTNGSTLLDGFVDSNDSFTVPSGYVIRGISNICAPDTAAAVGIINFTDPGSTNNSWNSHQRLTPTSTQTGVQIKTGTWFQIVPDDTAWFVMTPKANAQTVVFPHATGPTVTIQSTSTGAITPIVHVDGPANAASCTGPAAGDQTFVESVTCDSVGGCGSGIGNGQSVSLGATVARQITLRWEIHVCVASYDSSKSYSSGVWVDQFDSSTNTSWQNEHYRGFPWASGTLEYNEFEYQTTPSSGSGEVSWYPRLFVDATNSEGPAPDNHLDVEGPEFYVCVVSC